MPTSRSKKSFSTSSFLMNTPGFRFNHTIFPDCFVRYSIEYIEFFINNRSSWGSTGPIPRKANPAGTLLDIWMSSVTSLWACAALLQSQSGLPLWKSNRGPLSEVVVLRGPVRIPELSPTCWSGPVRQCSPIWQDRSTHVWEKITERHRYWSFLKTLFVSFELTVLFFWFDSLWMFSQNVAKL